MKSVPKDTRGAIVELLKKNNGMTAGEIAKQRPPFHDSAPTSVHSAKGIFNTIAKKLAGADLSTYINSPQKQRRIYFQMTTRDLRWVLWTLWW